MQVLIRSTSITKGLYTMVWYSIVFLVIIYSCLLAMLNQTNVDGNNNKYALFPFVSAFPSFEPSRL